MKKTIFVLLTIFGSYTCQHTGSNNTQEKGRYCKNELDLISNKELKNISKILPFRLKLETIMEIDEDFE